MVEITKNENALLKQIDNSISIRQTMKSKRHRGKYFMEETKYAIQLLNYVRNNIFSRKENFVD